MTYQGSPSIAPSPKRVELQGDGNQARVTFIYRCCHRWTLAFPTWQQHFQTSSSHENAEKVPKCDFVYKTKYGLGRFLSDEGGGSQQSPV